VFAPTSHLPGASTSPPPFRKTERLLRGADEGRRTTGDPREELLRVAALCLRDQTGPVIRALPLVAGLPGVDPELLPRGGRVRGTGRNRRDGVVGPAAPSARGPVMDAACEPTKHQSARSDRSMVNADDTLWPLTMVTKSTAI
jgi:hypothetical protein